MCSLDETTDLGLDATGTEKALKVKKASFIQTRRWKKGGEAQ